MHTNTVISCAKTRRKYSSLNKILFLYQLYSIINPKQIIDFNNSQDKLQEQKMSPEGLKETGLHPAVI